MSQSLKATIQFIIVICGLVMGFSMLFEFADQNPNHTATWGSFAVSFLVATACIIVLVRFRKPKLEAPDILCQVTSSFFERDGFCFAPTIRTSGNSAVCRVWFQNNFTNPCFAIIAMEPASGLFDSGMFRWLTKRSSIKPFSIQVEAPSGGFGFVESRIALPAQSQGRTQKFFVGAHAKYPDGRGPRIRSKTGLAVGKTTNNPGLGELAAAAGAIVISSPAKLSIALPTNVEEETPPDVTASTRVLWTLGDSQSTNLSIDALLRKAELGTAN